MIGGVDVILQTGRAAFDVRRVLDSVLGVWPEARFQDGDADAWFPLAPLVERSEGPALSREFFIYKDEASAASWDRDGRTDENGDDMAHFLIRDLSGPDRVEVTVVVGSTTAETARLITAVDDALEGTGEDADPNRGESRRIDWDDDLREAGYSEGRDQFHQQVEGLRRRLHPAWTVDELACHPREALLFCEAVRREIGPVPDHFVMKALMNHRRGRAKAS